MAITLTSGNAANTLTANKSAAPKSPAGNQNTKNTESSQSSSSSDNTTAPQTGNVTNSSKFAELFANLQVAADPLNTDLSKTNDLSKIAGRLSSEISLKNEKKSDQKTDDASTLVATSDNPLAFLMGIQPTQNLPQQPALNSQDGGVMDLLKKGVSREVLYGTEPDKTELSRASSAEGANSSTPLSNLFSSALQQAQNQNPVTTAPTSEAKYDIPAPVHDQTAWSKQLGDRVVFMNQQGQQTAEIHLNPSNLGPLHVTLSFNGESGTTASFVAQHAETRQAIQDALPQLREMFVQAGIALGDTNVSSQSQQQQQQNQEETRGNLPHFSRDGAILPTDSEQNTVVRAVPLQRGNGLVDLFA